MTISKMEKWMRMQGDSVILLLARRCWGNDDQHEIYQAANDEAYRRAEISVERVQSDLKCICQTCGQELPRD